MFHLGNVAKNQKRTYKINIQYRNHKQYKHRERETCNLKSTTYVKFCNIVYIAEYSMIFAASQIGGNLISVIYRFQLNTPTYIFIEIKNQQNSKFLEF